METKSCWGVTLRNLKQTRVTTDALCYEKESPRSPESAESRLHQRLPARMEARGSLRRRRLAAADVS